MPRCRFQPIRLKRLEDRLTPAIPFVGPLGVTDQLTLESTGGTAWLAFGQRPEQSPNLTAYFEAERAWYFQLDRPAVESTLNHAPWENSPSYADLRVMSIPRPDGSFQRFHVWQMSIMEPGLAEQFPDIRTYRGQGIDDPTATLAMDVTAHGFHAQVMAAESSYYIDPYYHLDQSVYIAYYKTHLLSQQHWQCSHDHHVDGVCSCCSGARGEGEHEGAEESGNLESTSNGGTLRNYRTAVAGNAEYTAFHGGTVPLGQAAIVTAMNRVSGVYETELAVRLILVANNSNLVFTDTTTDGYTNGSGTTMLSQNQSKVDTVIGSANYDLGHVFSTGGGGVAGLGVVAINGQKARGVTGQPAPVNDSFWIDYVAHEMGHQFGGSHTFNGGAGKCAGNRSASSAYEQGSGNTIMAYAGICATDDLQPHSDAYFHSRSLDQITAIITARPGLTPTATNNTVPTVSAGSDYTIPAMTPFMLTGQGDDIDGDEITYTWEERDLGPSTTILTPDNGSSPLFRPFNPTSAPSRVFPDLENILANTNPIPAQIMPATNRFLNFRLVVRDNKAGGGAFNTDDMKLTVVNTGEAFVVTSPNTAVSWIGDAAQTITWNVAGTSGNGINTTNVDISLSTDGGSTYPIMLAANAPNDGSQIITVPNVATTEARIKIAAVNNVFFDLSNIDFEIIPAPPTVDNVDVNDGSIQRSAVSSLTVNFNSPVQFVGAPHDAFQLTPIGGGPAVPITVSGGAGQSVVTFEPLSDGLYTLTALSSQIQAVNGGAALDGDGNGTPGGDFTFNFHRLFGDSDGDRKVDSADFISFRSSFNFADPQPSYLSFFDANDDDKVDSADFVAFRTRFNSAI